GYRYIHSGDEPLLIAGVATGPLEMLQSEPGLQVLIVPIGGGSGAAGAPAMGDWPYSTASSSSMR
ncbi:MAG: hypothetical protein ACJ8AG_10825, partial [Ktedonobacteraceae bacterium]